MQLSLAVKMMPPKRSAVGGAAATAATAATPPRAGARGSGAPAAARFQPVTTPVCEAGARTAQEQEQGETAEKRPCNSVSGAEWHDGACAFWRAFLFLSLAPERLSSVELRDSPEFRPKPLSKVKHIARPAYCQALKCTASQGTTISDH